jgi:hypothetical protein
VIGASDSLSDRVRSASHARLRHNGDNAASRGEDVTVAQLIVVAVGRAARAARLSPGHAATPYTHVARRTARRSWRHSDCQTRDHAALIHPSLSRVPPGGHPRDHVSTRYCRAGLEEGRECERAGIGAPRRRDYAVTPGDRVTCPPAGAAAGPQPRDSRRDSRKTPGFRGERLCGGMETA